MTESTNLPQSLSEVLKLYFAHVTALNPKRADGILNQTRTAVIRYTLPGWGFRQPIGKKLTSAEVIAAEEFMKGVSLEQVWSALDTQEVVFEKQSVSNNTRRNYRYHLKALLDWCKSQSWQNKPSSVFKRKVHDKNSSRPPRLTNKRSYTRHERNYVLKPSEYSSRLKEELDGFYTFFTSFQSSTNQEKSLRPRSVNCHTDALCRFLGWLNRCKGLPLEELSLETIVPFIHLKDSKRPLVTSKKAKLLAGQTVELICEYLQWLRVERECDVRSEAGVIRAVIAAAKFLYAKETDYPEVEKYLDIPVINLLRREQRKVNERHKKATPPSSLYKDKKWIEWPDYLKAVEQLRQECSMTLVNSAKGTHPQTIGGSIRCFQRYLLAAFLAYIPPDRLRTYSELEIGRTLVNKSSRWWIHLLPVDYKTGDTYGEYWGEIPNVKFNDGSCFYDYINTWLDKWRQKLNPSHNYFFTTEIDKSFMVTQRLSSILRCAIYRITGKVTTPHLLRSIFVTYLKEQGAPDAVMESVAYAMHHSVDMQRSIYDDRTQQERSSLAFKTTLEIALQTAGDS